jgi:hypothetical protein
MTKEVEEGQDRRGRLGAKEPVRPQPIIRPANTSEETDISEGEESDKEFYWDFRSTYTWAPKRQKHHHGEVGACERREGAKEKGFGFWR